MKTKVLNYRILVEKDPESAAYVAYAPSLGVSDFGNSVGEAVAHIEQAIKLYLETLMELKQPVPPPDGNDYYVTTRAIELGTTASR